MILPDDIFYLVLYTLFECDPVLLLSFRLVNSTFRKMVDEVLKEEHEITSSMLEASLWCIKGSSILKRITSLRLMSPLRSRRELYLSLYLKNDPNRCIYIGEDGERCTNNAELVCHCKLHQQVAMSNPPKCFMATLVDKPKTFSFWL